MKGDVRIGFINNFGINYRHVNLSSHSCVKHRRGTMVYRIW